MRAKAFLVLTFVLFAISSGLAGTQKVLYAFTGGADGGQPYAGVIFDPAGNLYGVAQYGGLYNQGAVFKLTPSTGGAWTETVLYNFTGGADGTDPVGGLTIDTSGNLYGTTSGGGDPTSQCGTMFELSPSAGGWTFTLLRSFLGAPTDGCSPGGDVVIDQYGRLYPTTVNGGAYNDGAAWGDGRMASLGLNKGSLPWGGLNGWWFGTAYEGGSHGVGTVYTMALECDPRCTEQAVVTHSFSGGKGGSYPLGDLLVQAVEGLGIMYGTTYGGGADNSGIAYQLTQHDNGSWTFSVLYTFPGSGLDGSGPGAGLTMDSAGNLYGTTMFGGANAGYAGTVFELTPGAKNKWTEILQYSFSGGTDGGVITSGVVFDTAGNLYGTASTGGAHNQGVVYEVTPSAATTTTLTSSPNPSTHDQAVIFTAVVASKIGAPPDGETVSFMKGKTVLGTGSLSGGSASFTTAKLPVGTDSITAIYGGDSNFDASTSNVVAQVVEKAGT
jgi:uncharacterized repeat protein (TIGR03803 family)